MLTTVALRSFFSGDSDEVLGITLLFLRYKLNFWEALRFFFCHSEPPGGFAQGGEESQRQRRRSFAEDGSG
jgi:hypothetical protein